MQIKMFTVPIIGGELLMEDLNLFLRSKKIIQVEKELLAVSNGAFWCFCITWVDNAIPLEKEKPDYKKLLNEASFARFAKFRDIRRKVAQEEAIPAYAIFTDEELAEMAKVDDLTLPGFTQIKGVGEKKIAKYARYFIEKAPDEKGG